MSLKGNIAPLPSTSPALPGVWVGECPGSRLPTPTPRMLGRSSRAGVSTGDVRHPLPSPTHIRLFSPWSSRPSRPVRFAESIQSTDGRREECPFRTRSAQAKSYAQTPPSFIGRSPIEGPRPAGRTSPSYGGARRNGAHPVHVLPLQGAKTALHNGVARFCRSLALKFCL